MGIVKTYHKTGKIGAAIKPPYTIISSTGEITVSPKGIVIRAKRNINIDDWFRLSAMLRKGVDCKYCNYKGVCCDKNVLDRTTCLDNLDKIRDNNVLNKGE